MGLINFSFDTNSYVYKKLRYKPLKLKIIYKFNVHTKNTLSVGTKEKNNNNLVLS